MLPELQLGAPASRLRCDIYILFFTKEEKLELLENIHIADYSYLQIESVAICWLLIFQSNGKF